MKKCINCSWEGDNVVPPLSTCPVCGDNTIKSGKVEKKEQKPKPKPKTVESEKITIPKSKPTILARVKDYAEDLLDDGKRNRSNRKKKKGGKK